MESRLQKQRIYSILERFSDKLVSIYLKDGPDGLKNRLNISDSLWTYVFDFLVIEKEVVKQCIRGHTDYVHGIFASYGPQKLRAAFHIESSKYDYEWSYIMDYIGISRGALYEYITNNQNEFRKLITEGKLPLLRNTLYINEKKYNRVWEEILDMLLACVSTHASSHSLIEHGLTFFMTLYNKNRTHRSLRKSSLSLMKNA